MARDGLTGVLLVGGASRRFGSPKALAEFDGESLAARAWRILGETCAERIAVGKSSDRLPLPFPVLDDGFALRAPIAGVVAGLRAAKGDVCLVLPLDCPLLSSASLCLLADEADMGTVAIPQTGPLPGAYPVAVLPALERSLSAGEYSLRRALDPRAVRVVEVDPRELVNVNTEPELKALLTPPDLG